MENFIRSFSQFFFQPIFNLQIDPGKLLPTIEGVPICPSVRTQKQAPGNEELE